MNKGFVGCLDAPVECKWSENIFFSFVFIPELSKVFAKSKYAQKI